MHSTRTTKQNLTLYHLICNYTTKGNKGSGNQDGDDCVTWQQMKASDPKRLITNKPNTSNTDRRFCLMGPPVVCSNLFSAMGTNVNIISLKFPLEYFILVLNHVLEPEFENYSHINVFFC